MRRPTLLDLAKELNLSTSTISRALTRPGVVKAATRERILAAIEKVGYSPNGVARSLRKRETKTIGIIVPDITNWFFGVIIRAISGVVGPHGYTMVVFDANEDPEAESKALQSLRERQVSGIIRCPVGGENDSWKAVVASGTPVIELDRFSGLANVDTVLLDDEQAGKLAAKHLIGLGHTKIGTIAGPQHLNNGRGRLRGFLKSLSKASVPVPPEWIEYGDFRETSGYVGAQRLVSLGVRPTAIFVANSEMTGGAIAALRDLNVEVPRELSLIGFDDARWARYLDPPLTMIAHPTPELGRCAAELLLRRLRSAKPVREAKAIRFTPELVVRGSTAPPPDFQAQQKTRLWSAQRNQSLMNQG
jgi:DNA-binding LacI/PurR family transcriptional regulator